LIDVAMKVVGIGSVGTHSMVGLMHCEGAEAGSDPIFLQVKEASASVLEPHLGPSEYPHHGQRVVVGQRMMQAFPDIFLGWTEARQTGRHYYVRQLHDMKGSADITRLEPAELAAYGATCAWTLARAHTRSGDAAVIAGYLGSGPTFDRAIAGFAESYADQNQLDFEALTTAAREGRVPVAVDA
jgi:uncharacterized protein (DUF2252 family)